VSSTEITLDPIIDGVQAVLIDGRKVGEVHRGVNGEWYHVTMHESSWADPLQGLDNIRGTGLATAAAAAEHFRPIEEGRDFRLAGGEHDGWEARCHRCSWTIPDTGPGFRLRSSVLDEIRDHMWSTHDMAPRGIRAS
jgi:hypothetical protein